MGRLVPHIPWPRPGLTSNTNSNDDIPETISVVLKLPDALQTRAFKDESSVNLLNIAIIIYNNELIEKPELGNSKIIVFLKNEKMEYDFKVHGISFNPTMDLENIQLFAEISSSDDKMIERLIVDGILSFYVSGKLTQNSDKELETIVISKIISHVDQTAYAKKFNKIKKTIDPGIPPEFLKKEIFAEPNLDKIEMNKVSRIWEEFSKKVKNSSIPPAKKPSRPPPTLFDKWRKAIKKIPNP